MKSITIHALDDEVDALIREKARTEGRSLNKTIQSLLREALGVGRKTSGGHRSDFEDLFGCWTKTEARTFLDSVKDLRTVDPGDWQ